MGIQKFEDLIAWQKAQDLAVAIYERFSASRDFGFRDQTQRAAISISNNMAEGFDRPVSLNLHGFCTMPSAHAAKRAQCCIRPAAKHN